MLYARFSPRLVPPHLTLPPSLLYLYSKWCPRERHGIPQVYVQKVSPQKTPMVVGKLLDLDAPEDFIRQLLNSVGHQCPVDELVEQVRGKGVGE